MLVPLYQPKTVHFAPFRACAGQSWYNGPMTIPKNPEILVSEAENLAQTATLRRRAHRRENRSPERDNAILPLLDDIDSVMRPLRSFIGHFQYQTFGVPLERRATAVSIDLQYERRQLKKMLHEPRGYDG